MLLLKSLYSHFMKFQEMVKINAYVQFTIFNKKDSASIFNLRGFTVFLRPSLQPSLDLFLKYSRCCLSWPSHNWHARLMNTLHTLCKIHYGCPLQRAEVTLRYIGTLLLPPLELCVPARVSLLHFKEWKLKIVVDILTGVFV